MDLEAFGWLVTVEGQAALDEADRLLQASDLIVAGERLRRRITPEQAAVVTSQVTLRRAARAKLGDLADRLYFTAEGLEQATRPEVARHRAERLAATGPTRLADLGCGIGADLLAFAHAGLSPAGFDLDAVRVAVARANLAALGLEGTAEQADITALDLTRFDVVFADPARRKARGRVFDPDDYAPSWSFVERLLSRPACVKAAPGLAHDRVPGGVEAEWVSWRGGVKEVALWSPHLATTRRRATVLSPAGAGTMTDVDVPDSVEVRRPGRFLLEPDGAVIRAGLVAGVAAQVGGWLLDEHIAYVSTDAPPHTAYARSFEVQETLPFQEKRLRAALRERGIGRLTIKKRGVDVVPDQLRKRLRLSGDHEATIVLTRSAGRGIALLVKPLDGHDSPDAD